MVQAGTKEDMPSQNPNGGGLKRFNSQVTFSKEDSVSKNRPLDGSGLRARRPTVMRDFDKAKWDQMPAHSFKGVAKGVTVKDKLVKEGNIQPPSHVFHVDYALVDELGVCVPSRPLGVGNLGATKEINIYDVVDSDDHELLENYVGEKVVGKILGAAWFKFLILGAIMANSVLIGLQTNDYLRFRYQYIFQAIDFMFLTIFSVEILLRWYHDFFAFWLSGWNVMDFVLVAVSLFGEGLSFISTGRVLRVLRVLRAARGLSGLRSLKLFERLQLIVQTLLQSIPDIINISVLLLMSMFIFAVIGVNLFQDAAPEWFGNLYDALFTLFIFVTMDGWLDVYADLDEGGMALMGALYIITFTVIGSFVFANVISGVTVTNLQTAEEVIHNEKVEAKRELVGENAEKIQTADDISTANVSDVFDGMWEAQIPMDKPNIKHNTPSQMEKYSLVLMCIEQNLDEYSRCRAELEDIFEEVKKINQDQDDSDDDMTMGEIDAALLRNEVEMKQYEDGDADVIAQRLRMGI